MTYHIGHQKAYEYVIGLAIAMQINNGKDALPLNDHLVLLSTISVTRIPTY